MTPQKPQKPQAAPVDTVRLKEDIDRRDRPTIGLKMGRVAVNIRRRAAQRDTLDLARRGEIPATSGKVARALGSKLP